jgi:DNA-binding helix-hairpin-helix protein with protein kinase domain
MTSLDLRIGGAAAPLGKPLGRGGEGDVYALANRSDVAIKVYKPELRGSREAKVRAMVSARLADKSTLVAFPASTATDARGSFAGFAMRLVSGYRPIHQLYSPKSRKYEFPKATYHFLVRVARNVARAVATVHDAGCVIGDFNHSGVLVGEDGTVSLIDADSFQFSFEGHTYPCVVGTEDFTPPELHGVHLATVQRTRAHDNFGLAVAIFQLLAMGKHPYMGVQANHPDLSLGEAIAKHLFAYSTTRAAATRTRPPPGSVALSDFPAPVASAFEAAFGLNPTVRPSPAIWETLLGELERSLRQCATVTTHLYPNASGACVWCRLTSQSGVEMFPGPLSSSGGAAQGNFDIRQILAALRAVVLPPPGTLLPQLPADLGPPTASTTGTRGLRVMLGIGALVAAAVGFAAAPHLFLIWLALAGFALSRFASVKPNAPALKRSFEELDRRAQQLSIAHLQRIGYAQLSGVRAEMELLADQYGRLDADLQRELHRIRDGQEARHRNAYLDTIFIERAKISGIGQVKARALLSFGIETAADVTYTAVRRVPGFGDALTQKLLIWRAEQERKFRYSPAPTPADRLAEDAARAAVADAKRTLETRLRAGMTQLQQAPSLLISRSSTADPALHEALIARARLTRDARTAGIVLPAPTPVVIPPTKPAPGPTVRFPHVQAGVPGSASHPPKAASAASPPSGPINAPACPVCASRMVRRTAKRGRHVGTSFWSCSRFPHCPGKRP